MITTKAAHIMDGVQKERIKRKEELQNLLSMPFDINNKSHFIALTIYLNEFERSTHLRSLYLCMNEGLKAYGGAWLVGFVLPVPEFINSMLWALLYTGIAGFSLEKLSETDYFEQLEEMRQLYNWCLKSGEATYSPHLDNTEKLAQPEIQRLVKALAPFCSVDFMLAWRPEMDKPVEATSGLLSSVFSLFASKPTVDLTQIRELKIAVETRSLDLGIYKGFEQAMAYFATNLEFRELLKSKVNIPLNQAKEMLPSLLASSNH